MNWIWILSPHTTLKEYRTLGDLIVSNFIISSFTFNAISVFDSGDKMWVDCREINDFRKAQLPSNLFKDESRISNMGEERS